MPTPEGARREARPAAGSDRAAAPRRAGPAISDPLTTFRETLVDLVRARFPYLYIQTVEDERLLQELRELVARPPLSRHRRSVFTWSVARGLTDDAGVPRPHTEDLGAALDVVEAHDGPALFVFFDLHRRFRPNGRPDEQRDVRRLRELRPALTSGNVPKAIVLVAPEVVLPPELAQEVYVLDLPLPGAAELQGVLDQIVADNPGLVVDLDADERGRLVNAALGLTRHEAENAFARGAVHDKRLDGSDIELVLEEKRQAIRKTTLLEYVGHHGSFDDIGGLDHLKDWLAARDGVWSTAAQQYGLKFPRGVLITGVPGCGKSLTARCTSATWQLPLLRLDVGRIFAGIVGTSEQNMRTAIRTAEALAPCVLYIDEIEKGFGGRRQDLDSGTSSRVFGTFLTWMQEKTAPVFVIATANDISALPPEFLRKGRFDEIFFVDLPTTRERAEIFRIHLARLLVSDQARGSFPMVQPAYDHLARAADEFSGAEIEQAIIAAMFRAFAERRSVEVDDVLWAIRTTVPLSRTQAEQLQVARAWANQRAVAATNPGDLAGFRADHTSEDALVRGGRTLDFDEEPT
jgi:ATP-dependent 26S proteasome regulatory subunit